MLRSFPKYVLCAALLIMIIGIPIAAAQTTIDDLVLEAAVTVPGSGDAKHPQIVGREDSVFVTANPGEEVAYWSKAATADDFPRAAIIGESGENTDIFTSAIAVGPDGAVYVVWSSFDDEAIYVRRKPPGQNFQERKIVKRGSFTSPGATDIDVAVASDGKVFVTWREVNKAPQYTVSSDNGNNWAPRRSFGDLVSTNSLPFVAAGPNGKVVVAYSAIENDGGSVFLARWNGRSFDTERVSRTSPSAFATDPSVSIGGSGKVYMAWRTVEVGNFYAVEQDNGSFGISRLTNDGAEGAVIIAADAQDNLHIGWVRQGNREFYYAYQRAGDAIVGPRRLSNGGASFNADGVATLGDKAYGHFVHERFTGNSLTTRYLRFAAPAEPVTPPVAAQPVIENNATIVANKPTLSVAFSNVVGTPNEVRYRWGAAPDDTNPWQAFTNPLAVPPPANLDVDSCAPITLYTQVRDTVNGATDTAKTAVVTIDGGIQTDIRAVNPYTNLKDSIFTPVTSTVALQNIRGANDGDLGYTRVPVFYLELKGNDECSGLKDFAIGQPNGVFGSSYAIANDAFANVVAFPNLQTLALGPNNLVIRVTDKAGNVANATQTIIFDDVKPQVQQLGALTAASSDRQASLITALTISDTVVTDNLYPGKQFWGVWIANSRTPIEDPANDDSLNWSAVPMRTNSAPFTIGSWSLASGLNANQVTPGEYYVYMRFIDGAGNVSDQFLTTTVTLTDVTGPKLYQPLVLR